jgi:hypothetical protein
MAKHLDNGWLILRGTKILNQDLGFTKFGKMITILVVDRSKMSICIFR